MYRYLEHYLPQEEAPKDIYRAASDAAVDMTADFKAEVQQVDFADADTDSALYGTDADADVAYSLNLPDADSEQMLQDTVLAADDDSTLSQSTYDLLGERFAHEHQDGAEVRVVKRHMQDTKTLILESTLQKSGKSATPAKQQAITARQGSLLTASSFSTVPVSTLPEGTDDRYFLSAEYQKWIVDSAALPEEWDLLELPIAGEVQDTPHDWEMLGVPEDFTAQVMAPEPVQPHFYMVWPQPQQESEAIIPAITELRSNPDMSQMQQLGATYPDKEPVTVLPTSEPPTTFAPQLGRKETQLLPRRHGQHYQHRSGGSRTRATSVERSR